MKPIGLIFNPLGFTWIDGFLYKFIKWYRGEGANAGIALKLILKSGIMSLTNPRGDLFKEVESRLYLGDKKLPYDSHLFLAAGTVKRLVFGFRILLEPGPKLKLLSFNHEKQEWKR